jgi:hypothetical protein
MTAGGIPGLYGGYSYQSPTLRALGKITPESYDYRDQTKVVSKLVGDVSFMGGMMRKMQKGIDEANQNFVQQIQSLLTDFLVLLGGGGDTGLDFGDLKYLLQAVGALFGFDQGVLPINLFQAAWHFFSTYIVPVDNFKDLMDFIIDGAIASILDIFGEVPIVGQALQQLAVIISEIRDILSPIAAAIDAFFDAFNIDIDNIEGIGDFFGPLKPIWDAISAALDGVELPDFTAVFHIIAQWSIPFVNLIVDVIDFWADLVSLITSFPNAVINFANNLPLNLPFTLGEGGANPILMFVYNFLQLFNITGWLNGDFNPLEIWKTVIDVMFKPTGLLAWLDPITGLLPDFQAPKIVSDIILTIESAFEGLPFIGDYIKPIFDVINGLLGIGNNAQGSANTANSQVTAIWATLNGSNATGGVTVVEDFNGAQSSSPPSSFETVYFGPGAGNDGIDGQGNLSWNENGAAWRGVLEKHNTPLGTDFGTVAIVWNQAMEFANPTPPVIKLQGRMNSAKDTWVEVSITRNFDGPFTLVAGCSVAGTYTQIGTPVTGITLNDGDTLEFRFGTSVHNRQLLFLRNGLTVLDKTDTGNVSALGASYRFPAMTRVAGVAIAYWLYFQRKPADVGVFAASDRKIA